MPSFFREVSVLGGNFIGRSYIYPGMTSIFLRRSLSIT